MWWMAAAWAGWSATVAVEDHGGPPIIWTVDDTSAHPPVTWTGPDGELRRALVTALHDLGDGRSQVKLLVQTLRGRRWTSETERALVFRDASDSMVSEGALIPDGSGGWEEAWFIRVNAKRTEGPEVIWLAAYVAAGEPPPSRSLAISPGLVCEGLEVAAEGAATRITFPASEARSGGVQRWRCTRDAGATPVEVRLVVW
jgi:hypothetical protein